MYTVLLEGIINEDRERQLYLGSLKGTPAQLDLCWGNPVNV